MKVLAIYGSPRVKGNTEILMNRALEGAKEKGAEVSRIYLRKVKIKPCLELGVCETTGTCPLDGDDFEKVEAAIKVADALLFSSPVMFYTVSTHAKILMDRCQVFWARRRRLKQEMPTGRPGALISVGATNGKRLFDGVLLTVKSFFDEIGFSINERMLIRGVDGKGEITSHPELLEQAYQLGCRLVSLD